MTVDEKGCHFASNAPPTGCGSFVRHWAILSGIVIVGLVGAGKAPAEALAALLILPILWSIGGAFMPQRDVRFWWIWRALLSATRPGPRL